MQEWISWLLAAAAGVSLAMAIRALIGRGPRRATHWWQGFFSARQYRRFVREVESYFEREGEPATVDDGVIVFHDASNAKRYGQIGLLNLAQTCQQHPTGEWPRIIGEFVATMKEHAEFSNEFEEKEKSFDAVKDYLAVRLHGEDVLEPLREDVSAGETFPLIYNRDIEGTVSVLVYDLPNMVRSVHRKILARWDRTQDELMALGWAYVRRNTKFEIRPQPLETGGTLYFMHGADHFVASLAMSLDEHPELIGRHGSIVALPTRHFVLSYPIEDAAVLPAMNAIFGLVQKMYGDGPGSLCPHIYWYRRNTYMMLPYEIGGGGKVQLGPPEEFLLLIQKLTGKDQGSP